MYCRPKRQFLAWWLEWILLTFLGFRIFVHLPAWHDLVAVLYEFLILQSSRWLHSQLERPSWWPNVDLNSSCTYLLALNTAGVQPSFYHHEIFLLSLPKGKCALLLCYVNKDDLDNDILHLASKTTSSRYLGITSHAQKCVNSSI